MDVITSHINAEFDSFASMVAARRLFPEALIVFPGAQERNLRLFLDNYPHGYTFRRMRSIRLEKIDRLIVVDTRRADRIGRLAEVLDKEGIEVHLYDHHPASPRDIRGARETVEEVGANITLFVELFRQRQMRITPAEATIFGLGLYEDTGSLSFTSTTPRDIRAAAYLLECGLDLRVVSDYVTRELTPEQVSLLNDLLESREFVDVNGLPVALATASRERFVGDLAVLGHKMKDIENLNVLFILVQMHDRVHLVARSRIEVVDVGEIAAALGGGGHPTAASAVIRGEALEEVRKRLVQVVKEKVKPVHSARDLMSTTLKVLDPGATIGQAHEILSRYGIDHLPVVDGGRLLGVVHREAVERSMRHGYAGRPAADFMNTDFEPITRGDSIYRMQDLFLNHGQHFLPVIERGKLVGAVTRSDLLGVMREEAWRKPIYRFGPGRRRFKVSRNLSGILKERLPRRISRLLTRLSRVGRRLGVNVYLVGGFVRDLILDVPNLDLDVVVEGNGIAFARAIAAELGGRVRSHKRFETAVVVLPDGLKIDVATARMEYYTRPGALPTVEHGSIRMDLFRRDFTINALAVQLSGHEFGRLIDFFGGQKDLEEGAVRVLHDLSFEEDPTRIFRAVRFEQRLNFTIGEHTLKLMRLALRNHLIEAVAGSRLLGELEEVLNERDPVPALKRLQELGLLAHLHPALGAAPPDERLLGNLRTAIEANRPLLHRGFCRWLVFLAGLSRQFALEELNSLVDRLGMSVAQSRLLTDIYVGHRRLLSQLEKGEWPPSRVYGLARSCPVEVILFTIGCYPGTDTALRLERYLPVRGKVKTRLSGEDLKEMGYLPGPFFRKILEALRDAQLDGLVKNKREARAWVSANFPPPDREAL